MGVADGDSLLLELPSGERVRVRLFGIDAPEKDQDFALTARKKLTRLVYDKNIRVEVQDIDKYGQGLRWGSLCEPLYAQGRACLALPPLRG